MKLDVNLPRITPEATEWDKLLYRALWYQFRLNMDRIAAIERTLGTTPTKGGWINRQISVQTATPYTVLDDDYYMIENNAGATTYVLPDPVTNKGRELVIRSISAQAVSSSAANVVPLTGGAAGTAILSPVAGKWALLCSDGTYWQCMEGN